MLSILDSAFSHLTPRTREVPFGASEESKHVGGSTPYADTLHRSLAGLNGDQLQVID